MSTTIHVTTVLSTEVCFHCGMTFGMPETLQDKLRRTHETLWCPAGHRQSYRDESDVQKAERELQEERDRHDRTAAQLRDTKVDKVRIERRLAATKGVVTKVRKRIAAGVCPCCKRSFTNVRRHMASKHPDYAPS